MKYNFLIFFLSLFLINAQTFSMDKMSAQESELANANLAALIAHYRINNGITHYKTPIAPSLFPLQAEISPAPGRRIFPATRFPKITASHILVVAGITYATAVVSRAYYSFTDEERAKAGKIKLSLLVALRTGKNILSRPVQSVRSLGKLVGFHH